MYCYHYFIIIIIIREALGLPESEFVEKLFHLLDTDDSGTSELSNIMPYIVHIIIIIITAII